MLCELDTQKPLRVSQVKETVSFPAVLRGAEFPPLNTGQGNGRALCTRSCLHPGSSMSTRPVFVYRSLGLPLIECQCHLVSPHSSCYINFFSFSPLFCFVSSCLTGLLTIVYQVSPMWGPWGQAFSLIACLPPACSLGSPLSTFQTTLIITPLGPACSRHLRSLAGRFVSLLPPPLLSSLSWPLCSPPSVPPTSP